jgi:hypothetical protein
VAHRCDGKARQHKRRFPAPLRLNYFYRPDDTFFIVYNEQRNFQNGNARVERQLLLKLNRSFDFWPDGYESRSAKTLLLRSHTLSSFQESAPVRG